MSAHAKVLILLAALLTLIAVPAANAMTSTIYYPTPSDLSNLDHYYNYTWGIDLDPNATIVEAVLRINQIRDWTYESGDSLYMHLLDYAPLGVSSSYDNQGGGDAFAGNPWIATFSDPYGDYAHRQNLSYSFSSLGLIGDLNSYAANDGRIGLGFDPDCHYYNCGVELEITTSDTTVPEPTTLLLLGLGLVGAAFYRRVS
jgi:hypothetical protein